LLQVFHICEESKKISFLCPNGTIFQQSELICEWWFKVNCTNSPDLYEESAEQLREENAKRKLSRRVQNHGAVMRTEEHSSVSAVQNGRNFEGGNRASKRVFTENGRQENRFNNHAPNYRDNLEQEQQSNDLSRASSSDFFRDRGTNTPVPFQKEDLVSEEPRGEVNQPVDTGFRKQNQRGRKPVQFQHHPSVNNEDQNEEKAGTFGQQKTEERRPVQFSQRSKQGKSISGGGIDQGNRNRQQNQNQDFRNKPSNSGVRQQSTSGNFNSGNNQQFGFNGQEEKQIVTNSQSGDQEKESTSTSNGNFEGQKPFGSRSNGANRGNAANTGFRQQTSFGRQNQQTPAGFQKNEESKPDGFQQETGFDNSNRGFETENGEDRSPKQTSFDRRNNGFNSNRGNRKPIAVNRNGFKQQNSFNSQSGFNSNNNQRGNANDGQVTNNRNGAENQQTPTSFQKNEANSQDSSNVNNGFQQQSGFGTGNGEDRSPKKTSFDNRNQGFNTNSGNRKPVSTNRNGFQQQNSFGSQSGFKSNDHQNDNVKDGQEANNRNGAENQRTPTGFQKNEANKQDSSNVNNGFQQQNAFGHSNHGFETENSEDRSSKQTSFGNRNDGLTSNSGSRKPVSTNRNGFQQQNSFSTQGGFDRQKDNIDDQITNNRNENGNQRTPIGFQKHDANKEASSNANNGFQQENRFDNNNRGFETGNGDDRSSKQISFDHRNHGFNSNSENSEPVSTNRNGFQQQNSFSTQSGFNPSDCQKDHDHGDDQIAHNRHGVENQRTPTGFQKIEASKQSSSNVNNGFQQQSGFGTENGEDRSPKKISFDHGFNSNSGNRKPVSTHGNSFQQQNSFSVDFSGNDQQNDDQAVNNRNGQGGPVSASFNNDFHSSNTFKQFGDDKTEDKTVSNNFNGQQHNTNNQNLGFNNKNDQSFRGHEPQGTKSQFDFSNNGRNGNVLPSTTQVPSVTTTTNYFTSQREDSKFTSNHQNHDFGVTSGTPSTVSQEPIPLSTNSKFEDLNKGNFGTQRQQKISIGTGFPNRNQEAAFSTNNNHNKNVNGNSKDGTVKQKSTVPLTRNDIVNRRLEPSDSDEAQIPQETASFYKNSFNRIEQDKKSSSPNPHPNHRETYRELKEPKHYSTKSFGAISSVTPQYLTTQPINNGRPFVGSQVGTTFRGFGKNQGIVTTTDSYFTTSQPFTTTDLFNVGKTDRTLPTTDSPTTVTNVVPSELFNTGNTDKSFQPFALSTLSTFRPQPVHGVTVPSQGSFNLGITATPKPRTESSTGRVIDHATVYGKFVKGSSTTPSSGKSSILLSKSLFSGTQNGVTPTPFSLPPTQKISLSSTSSKAPSSRKTISLSKSLFGATPTPFSLSTTQQVPISTSSDKTSAEILSVSDSFNRGIPQVRFSGKVQSSTNRIPGVELHFNGNEKTSPVGYNSFSTTAKPFTSSTTAFSANSGSSSTAIPLSSTSSNSFGTTFGVSSTFAPSTTPTSINSIAHSFSPKFNSISTTPKSFGTKVSGFFITKNADNPVSTQKSIIGEIVRPRPFELPPEPDFKGRAVYSTTTENSVTTLTPTYPTYKISSASPFMGPSTPEPTQPTPFTTAIPTLPSTFENVDSMINALAEMATHNNFSSDGPRPGLVIPPSAGPQTLHTLAVYFANALDGIASDKDEEEEAEEEDEDNLTKVELEKKRLTELLTQMTMSRYNELFHDDKEENEETTTVIASRSKSEDEEDLEGQHTKGLTQEPPKVRQLAKVFTQALSSYLDDPATFRKVLEEVRPTEPPGVDDDDDEDTTDFGDDELLNFSDADSKSSYPPFFSTPPSARPTWGYLVAFNTSQNLDVKNSINPDLENLQGADTQSFVSQFNKLQNQNKELKETTTRSSLQLPEDHWTTSPGVTKLWKKAFSFDPASINDNFGTTEATTTTAEDTEEPEPTDEFHHEIKYEVRALPQLELNSTQVHGILIDFMNTTKLEDGNRLQRILRKLNTTEDEFLEKMKEIENNPLTRRLILLLISECGTNATQADTQTVSIHSLLGSKASNNREILETSSSDSGFGLRQPPEANSTGGYGLRQPPEDGSTSGLRIVHPSLDEESQDARALQLLNSLYTIASRFGK
jgi:hypothetical protein